MGKGSYGFRFQENPYPFVMNLWNVGWETQVGSDYDWHGEKRVEKEKIVFQYTLSGAGALTFEGRDFQVGEQEAFFVAIPSAHHYFFPKDAIKPWEFIYVTIEGPEAVNMHRYILAKHGPILKLSRDTEPIRKLFKLYSETAANDVYNSYIGSQKAYDFMLSLFRYLETPPKQRLKESLVKAIQYIEEHLAEPLSLDELAKQAGLSKYYFIKQFKAELHTTPMHYVMIARMKKAASLLAKTDDTIAEVAHQVGIDDPNYFTKVFKKTVGVSASKFRKNEDSHLIDFIVTEW